MITLHRKRTSGFHLTLQLLTVAVLLLTAYVSSAQITDAARQYVEGELLVKFRGGPKSRAASTVREKMQHEVAHDFDFIGWQHIHLPRGLSVEQGLKRYREMAEVLAAEPNRIIQQAIPSPKPQPIALAKAEGHATPIPDDPMFGQQYALARISASNAWAFTTGSSNVVVAVIDSGIHYLHEDLAANMWRNPGEIPNNGIDDDGNGYVDDVFGADPAGGDSDPMDAGEFHGTGAASMIGAVGANRTGITGLNWCTSLMAVRVFSDGTSNEALLLAGYQYVLLMRSRGINIRVANMSYGYGEESTEALDAAHVAMDSAGILQVNGAGNAGENLDIVQFYPANLDLPTIISVAGSDFTDGLAAFSSYGRTNVDLAAPAVGILKASGPATNTYIIGNGNSLSGPCVAGAAALLWAAYPSATALEVKATLLDSVDALPAFTNKMVSHGRLNVGRAMQLLGERLTNAPPNITFHPIDQTVIVSNSFGFSAVITGTKPMAYRWYLNGSLVIETTNATFSSVLAGTSDVGDYELVASNAFGVLTSSVARLTVLTTPVFVVQPQNRQGIETSNVTFTALATGHAPQFYQWQSNGSSLPGAIFTNLTLTNLTPDVEALYSVVASNSFGVTTSAIARLTVLIFPRMIDPVVPLRISVVPGEPVTLALRTTGSLPMSYRWRRSGLGVVITNMVLSDNQCFFTIVPTNSATYMVILTNAAQPFSTLQRTNAIITLLADTDGDGLPDVWETQHASASEPTGDADSDGMTNLEEYRAGTNPTNALDYLKIESWARIGGTGLLRFGAASNKTYSVQYRQGVASGAWNRLADILAAGTNREIEIIDLPSTDPTRFYRLVAPRAP